ncbi:MAG: helix-turn-helix domain-containing protein [Clostridiales bacterium]|jgi:transcriptional regulator with XRE-family HTH domain|nr:helix-turn-helix domain-containing protein [Clostridiales bacterium]
MAENIVGRQLRSLRESVKLSQYRLALVNGKIAQPAVNRYENGVVCPSLETLLWYADYFDVSLDYIFGRTDNPRGRLFDCKPKIAEKNEELAAFVEMCFDSNSPVNARLKETMLKLLEEKSSGVAPVREE